MALLPNQPGKIPADGGGFGGMSTKAKLWSVLIIVLISVVSLPTVILVFFGMLPTIVAYVVDRSHQNSATFCVGAMNFSGLFPSVLNLWGGAHTSRHAIDILTNVFDLFIIYGAASFGWMMFTVIPPLVTTFLTLMSERRVATLRAYQNKIIEEWGPEVAAEVERERREKLTKDGGADKTAALKTNERKKGPA